jgi:PAS domain S-box-containing protein
MGDGVIVLDSKRCVRLANKSAEAMLGRSEYELFGQPLEDCFRLWHGHKHEVDGAIRRAAPNRWPVDIGPDAALITPDRKEILIEGNLAPMSDQAGNLAGYVMVFRKSARSADRVRMNKKRRRRHATRVKD